MMTMIKIGIGRKPNGAGQNIFSNINWMQRTFDIWCAESIVCKDNNSQCGLEA